MGQNRTILVVGSGAREHALCWALEHSHTVARVLCTPGNGGITDEHRRNVKESDIPGIVKLAKDEAVDLVVVGHEAPLVAGLVDVLREAGIAVFGPNAKAAQLEGSKIYAKTFCLSLGIPTARWQWTDNYRHAEEMIHMWGSLPVIKADGLCGGKGVVVPNTKQQAFDAAYDILERKSLGDAGSRIIIEDRLIGREYSIMAFCDGANAVLLPPVRDYKRAHDGNKGLNTGGMGSYSPLPDVDDSLLADIKTRIIERTLYGMKNHENNPYHGLLYAGIMLTKDGPQLLEYNVRFGDPETQVVLPRVNHIDFVEHLFACLELGGLSALPALRVHPQAAVCIVLVSAGYPGKYSIGLPITGAEPPKGCAIFHAGTKRNASSLITSGGRVMSVVGFGEDIAAARKRANDAADKITFGNKYRRSDIAADVR